MRVKKCNSFTSRLIGFMFQKKSKKILYFKNCKSIHTCFCFFKLDIILLDNENKIIDIKKDIKPFRFYIFKCVSIAEYPSKYRDLVDIKKLTIS